MLEVRNLVKVYKTKGGVEVRALDDVTLQFPEKGMVFLLGKSGSGKSTLLNVSGGLDAPDSGEIIVKGKSSKEFSGGDFDSYRNTFVGFIFQEYNILDEFTVEQNIALALQLQGKPNDKNAVNELLTQVDLEGLGKRKPNTLSGGQKQRVAIARALIKNPEIIMADEPTGALDSKTGKQVFDTLKKLSQDKLVIVVSHDREFAEQYGDRIIELKDGKILSDESKALATSKKVSDNVSVVGGTVTVKDNSKLTEADVKTILTILKNKPGETVITTDSKDVSEVKRICKIHDSGEKEYFAETKEVKVSEYDGKETKFIKSKLPASRAIKMGASSLKVKPIRLIFTIFLAIIAFTMFGTLSTFMTYDPRFSIAEALEVSPYQSVALTKNFKYTNRSVKINADGSTEVEYEYEDYTGALFGTSELARINANGVGLNFAGVYTFGYNNYWGDSLNSYSLNEDNQITMFNEKALTVSETNKYAFPTELKVSGFTDCGEQFMATNGFSVLFGRYPLTANEVAISDYTYELIKANVTEVQGVTDVVGKTIAVGPAQNVTITGVYQIGGREKYLQLSNVTGTPSQDLVDLSKEYVSVLSDSFNTLIYVTPDFYSVHNNQTVYMPTVQKQGLSLNRWEIDYEVTVDTWCNYYTEQTVSGFSSQLVFFGADGLSKPFSIADGQVYVNANPIIERMMDFAQVCQNQYPMIYAEYMEAYAEYEETLSMTSFGKIFNVMLTNYETVYGSPIESSVYYKDCYGKEGTLTIAGYYLNPTNKYEDLFIIKKAFADTLGLETIDYNVWEVVDSNGNTYKMKNEYVTAFTPEVDAKYDKLISKTMNTREQTYYVLDLFTDVVNYDMTNEVYRGAKNMSDMVVQLKTIFLIAGSVVGVFAALMLLNFISTSISAKSKEIGILRAVGARGVDVFKIFFAESSIIATICFVISAIASFFVCNAINGSMMDSFVSIKLLNYGLMNVGLILAISFAVSFIATFLPVYLTARKSPVESIRAL